MYVDRREDWTVGELRKHLAKFDQNATVFMSQDEEGNGFAPLAEIGPSSVDRIGPGWTDEIGEDVNEKKHPVVVLWPNA